MKKLLLPFTVIAILLGLIAGNYFWKPGVEQSVNPADPPGGDFTLESINGSVSLSDFNGKIVLLYFGYTFCPDICPTSLSRIGGALKQLKPEELELVQSIMVSVDPERDNPNQLAQYTAFFHPTMIGVTGKKEQIDEIAKRYGVVYRKSEGGGTAAGYLVDHTSFIYVLDKDGKIREFLPHAVPVGGLVKLIRELLQGQ